MAINVIKKYELLKVDKDEVNEYSLLVDNSLTELCLQQVYRSLQLIRFCYFLLIIVLNWLVLLSQTQ